MIAVIQRCSSSSVRIDNKKISEISYGLTVLLGICIDDREKDAEYVAKKMAVERTKLILMHQTHSNKVVEIKKKNYKKKIIADAMITKMTNVALGVLTADCVPIIIYEAKNIDYRYK